MLTFSNPLWRLSDALTPVRCICGGVWGCTGDCEELLGLVTDDGRA